MLDRLFIIAFTTSLLQFQNNFNASYEENGVVSRYILNNNNNWIFYPPKDIKSSKSLFLKCLKSLYLQWYTTVNDKSHKICSLLLELTL